MSHSGQPLHACWFEDFLEHEDAIRRYQVHQLASGNLKVTLELTGPDVSLDVSQLKQVLEEHVGFAVDISTVDELPTTPAGKNRWITSELAKKTLV